MSSISANSRNSIMINSGVISHLFGMRWDMTPLWHMCDCFRPNNLPMPYRWYYGQNIIEILDLGRFPLNILARINKSIRLHALGVWLSGEPFYDRPKIIPCCRNLSENKICVMGVSALVFVFILLAIYWAYTSSVEFSTTIMHTVILTIGTPLRVV